ncbi:MAG: hypothetical protein GY778_06510 [bacterium]|nr:hypothetical protein [bacterium]
MTQDSGFAIAKKPDVLLKEYLASSLGEENAKPLRELCTVTGLDPGAYRGISRELLMPFPSLDEKVIAEFESTGGDMQTESVARREFCRLMEGSWPDSDAAFFEQNYDEDLLDTIDRARRVFSLLRRPEDYEIVRFRRNHFRVTDESLGFDLGYWDGDHFSVVCDCAVRPCWHPPGERDWQELRRRLAVLNHHLLFKNVDDAASFGAWYSTCDWAEEDPHGEFTIIQVEAVIGDPA